MKPSDVIKRTVKGDIDKSINYIVCEIIKVDKSLPFTGHLILKVRPIITSKQDVFEKDSDENTFSVIPLNVPLNGFPSKVREKYIAIVFIPSADDTMGKVAFLAPKEPFTDVDNVDRENVVEKIIDSTVEDVVSAYRNLSNTVSGVVGSIKKAITSFFNKKNDLVQSKKGM